MSFSLSLSGGGCKAAAHAGVLKALDRHNLTPTAVSGTSAGALVAAGAGVVAAGTAVLAALKSRKKGKEESAEGQTQEEENPEEA